MSFSDEARKQGFEIFKKGLVRRLSATNYVARNETDQGWHLVEQKGGKWNCDCEANSGSCLHLYAALLQRTSYKLEPESPDEQQLKCRYCGSPDIARCGFRYNVKGISRRYRCNECERKFSVVHVARQSEARPSELLWLLNEIGMLTARLTDLLSEVNDRIVISNHLYLPIPDANSPSESNQDAKPL
jgi:hypothetical protein